MMGERRCPRCNAPGAPSMILPFGSIRPREGTRYRCGRTEPESMAGCSSCDYSAQLRADLRRVEAERDTWRDKCSEASRIMQALQGRAERAEAERDAIVPGIVAWIRGFAEQAWRPASATTTQDAAREFAAGIELGEWKAG